MKVFKVLLRYDQILTLSTRHFLPLKLLLFRCSNCRCNTLHNYLSSVLLMEVNSSYKPVRDWSIFTRKLARKVSKYCQNFSTNPSDIAFDPVRGCSYFHVTLFPSTKTNLKELGKITWKLPSAPSLLFYISPSSDTGKISLRPPQYVPAQFLPYTS